MDWFSDPGAWLPRLVFTRGIALVYALAFVAAIRQGPALIGTNGLTPAPRFLQWADWRKAPSIFHLHWSDRFFLGCSWLGLALSVAALVGVADRLPLPAWLAWWLVLWAIYLSIVDVGQILVRLRLGVAAAGGRLPHRLPGARARGAPDPGHVAAALAAVPAGVRGRPDQDAR